MLARGWRRPSAEGNYRRGHAADFVPESMAKRGFSEPADNISRLISTTNLSRHAATGRS